VWGKQSDTIKGFRRSKKSQTKRETVARVLNALSGQTSVSFTFFASGMALLSSRQVRVFKALCFQHSNILRNENEPQENDFEVPAIKWRIKPSTLATLMAS
jgi:hypothetical protein